MATGGEFIYANRLAILAAGAEPEWVAQDGTLTDGSPEYTAPPTPANASQGVNVRGALVCGLDIRTRINPARRTCTVRATSFVGDGTLYSFLVNGSLYSVSGPFDTAQDLFDALVTELAVEALVTASVSGVDDAAILTVASVDSDDLAYGFSGDGTDVFVVQADASAASLAFYGRAAGSNTSGYWNYLPNSEYDITTDQGLMGPLLETPQLSRLFCSAVCTGVVGDGTEVIPTIQILFGPSFNYAPGLS